MISKNLELLTIICLVLITGYGILVTGYCFGEEMSSTNYKIIADSINVGGIIATTSNYRISDTIGETASGTSTASSYFLKAGYQQMHTSYIALSAPSDITLSPNLEEGSGGVSNGSGSATVTTDSESGYLLTIQASASPALFSAGDSFADYTPTAAGTPDYTWSVPVSASEFGFTPEGSDLVQKFQDNGAGCNLGSADVASACWYNLSTTAESISQSQSSNHTSGAATTLRFRAEVGASKSQTSGAYTATITLTAIAN